MTHIQQFFIALHLLTALTGFVTEAPAALIDQEDRALQERVTAFMEPLVDDGWTKGMIVGVLQHGKESYFGYGTTGGQNDLTPDRNTVFEIGSISKVFTSLLLADMVRKGEVKLDDPLQKFLPDDFVVPSPGDRPITLLSLATHQSGMTNVPVNFWEAGDNIYSVNTGGQRWGSYSEKKLRQFFQFSFPPFDKSRKYNYSNLGMGTLGYALEVHAGVPLETLIVKRICKPLNMDSTSFSIETSGPGHDADGNRVENWPQQDSILAGAFALRSSCKDLLALAHAHLEPTESPLSETIKLAIQPHGRISELEEIGLGWRINTYGVIQSVGATGGFRAAMFIHPPTKTAVVAMVNTQLGGVVGGRAQLFDMVAGILVNVVLAAPAPDLDLPKPAQADSSKFVDFVGEYNNIDGSKEPKLAVRMAGENLVMIGPGQMELRLWPINNETFFVRSYVSEIKFKRDESGDVIGADFQFDGKESKLKRNLK